MLCQRHQQGCRTAAALLSHSRPRGTWRLAICLIGLLLGGVSFSPLQAQNTFHSVPRFDRLTTDDGLPHSTVWASLQDTDGFIWFGTEQGLSRFDGYELITYEQDSLDPTTLSSNSIMSLVEDRQRRLWLGTYGGGVNLFQPRSETFVHFRHRPDLDESLSHDVVHSMHVDVAGNLWVGTKAGLSLIDGEGLAVRRIPLTEDGDEPRVLALLQDQNGILWMGSDCGLQSVDPAGPTSPCIHLAAPQEASQDPALDQVPVYALAEDSTGNLWVGTERGLYTLDTASSKLVRPQAGAPWTERPVQSLLVDRDGILWVGYSTEGLTRFDPIGAEISSYVSDPADPRSLGDDSVLHILEDRGGLLWFASYLGISRLDPDSRQFPTYRHQPDNSNSLTSNSIWAIHEDRRGHVWVGTFNEGLNQIDRRRGTVIRHRPDPLKPGSLTSGAINALEEGADGTLWVGTWAGLSLGHPDRPGFQTLNHRADDPSSLRHDIVQYLHEDRQGQLWVGTFQGLDRLQEDRRSFRHFGSADGVPDATSITSIVEDADGGIWFGSGSSGIFQWTSDNQGLSRLMHRPGDLDSLSSNKIASLYFDPAGYLWIGTYGSGLDRYDPQSGAIEHFRERDGLPNNTILGILQDDTGHLWISTFDGLGRLDPQSGDCTVYTQNHGLQGNTFSDGSYFKSRDGSLWFGGTAGLNIIEAQNLALRTEPPVVRLTGFHLLKESTQEPQTPWRQQFLDGKVTLEHHQDLFSIDFAALHYRNSAGHRYSYHLTGFDDTWIHTDARKRLAQYSNLDAGQYRFEVRGQTADGVASQKHAVLDIVVLPPPWQTWWAYVFYSLIALGALYVFLRRQHHKIDQERHINRQLRQVDQLKNDFLANTSHELRTPLHGMTGIAESLLDGAAGKLSQPVRDNLRLIVSSGRRLNALVDDLLDFSKLGRGRLGLHKKPVDLASLSDMVISLSRSLTADQGVTLRNHVPVTLPPAHADEHRLQQILHNLVANAIKFTDAGEITIEAEALDDAVIVRVRDTGIGIDEEHWEEVFEPFVQVDGSEDRRHGGAGLGLSVVRELIHLHQGEIWLDTNAPQGMVFSFSLPQAMVDADSTLQVEAIPRITEPLPQTPSIPSSRGPSTIPPSGLMPSLRQNSDHHILVVDDEPINRQILVNMLTVQGYRFTEVASGEEALQAVQGASFDLVLLDIMMPLMSGYEVCRTLRQTYSMQELPVVFLTAKGQDEDLVSGFAAGGNDYLTKPVRRMELISRVRSHLELTDLHRHLETLVEQRTRRISELNEELEARNAELERFTYTVSHDLKSPLVTIKGFLGFARQDALSGNAERVHKDFDRIAMATDKMHRLLESLLDVSRLSRLAPDKETLDIAEVIQRAAQQVAEEHPSIAMHVDIQPDLPQVIGDRQRLYEIFENLLRNSAQFMGEQTSPRVHVGCKSCEDWHSFYVRDNGIGIRAPYLEKVFDLFERLEDQGEGTGIGLTLARRIVESHGGKIWAESEGLGHGTTVYFTLPVLVQRQVASA